MRELNLIEMQDVSGGAWYDLSFAQRLEGALWGLGDGLITGVAIGGKVSGSGGFIAGAVNQLVSAIIGVVAGGVAGTVGGFIWGRDMIAETAQNYRETFGSASQGFGSL